MEVCLASPTPEPRAGRASVIRLDASVSPLSPSAVRAKTPPKTGTRRRGAPATGQSSHPSGLGVLGSHRFGFWTTPSLASLCDWFSPDVSLNSAPPFRLSRRPLLDPRLALLTEVLPSLSVVLQQPKLSCPPFHRPVTSAGPGQRANSVSRLGLALPCWPGDFQGWVALFGNQSIPCAPAIRISNSPP